MTNESTEVNALQQQACTQQKIQTAITDMFAQEDEALHYALRTAKEAGLPEIQISPIQGKMLQLLALACQAHTILEIGSLAGYSGIWLARSLPQNGRLITLEIDATHAEVVRNSFAHAGITDRAEVRVGKALELLPQLMSEAPFDLIFIDADKPPYPQYLDWALRLSRQGSIIVADNCIREGKALIPELTDAGAQGLYQYNLRASTDPQLTALALAMDDNYTDGFTISVVR